MHIYVPGLEGIKNSGYTVTPTGMTYTAYIVIGLMYPCTEEYLDCGIQVCRRDLVEWFALRFGRPHSHRQTIQRGMNYIVQQMVFSFDSHNAGSKRSICSTNRGSLLGARPL